MEAVAVDKRKYTYDDYLKTADDKHYELLNGNLIMSPSPVTKHQILLIEFAGEMRDYVKKNKAGRIFVAPYDVYFDKQNLTEPDILFVSKEREGIVTEKNIQGTPDLIVEIVSSGSIHRDTVEKKNMYEKFGVQEFWLVYPDEEMVEIYELKTSQYQLYKTFTKDEILDSPAIKGMKIKLMEIF